jgi:hypothetical protein
MKLLLIVVRVAGKQRVWVVKRVGTEKNLEGRKNDRIRTPLPTV